MNVENPNLPSKALILLLESEETLRAQIKTALEDEGMEICVIPSTHEVVDMINQRPVDLVLTDVMLTGETGMELLYSVKHLNPKVEVLLMTHAPSVNTAVQAMKMGAFDYIRKPVDIKSLIQLVKSAIEHKHASEPLTIPMPRSSSRHIAGYDIVKTLGEGQMGLVLLSKKEGETRAIKVIKQELSQNNGEALERFFREAESASRLNHPNIIKVFEYGFAHEENIPYLVMEYFDGTPLNKLIDSPHVNLITKVRIIRDLASALAATHAIEVIHRDVKPENCLVGPAPDWTVKLTDFGVAQLPNSTLTTTNHIVGTPYYLSPEGFSCPKVDHRADLYSLGVLAYELWLGFKPFIAISLAALGFMVQEKNPEEPIKIFPNFPVALQLILERLLKKRPESRYAKAEDLIADLDLWLNAQQGKCLLPPLQATWNTLP